MKQQEKDKFLRYCMMKQYPRQSILFEYFLTSLFHQIEQNHKTQMTEQSFGLPSISSLHLFMYVVLMVHRRKIGIKLLCTLATVFGFGSGTAFIFRSHQ